MIAGVQIRDLIIVGGGPTGLATAIAAHRAGLDALTLERGILVNSLFHYPRNMVFFTTPELLEIGGMPLVTPYEKPTRVEALRYYRRVADAFPLDIELGEEVLAVQRDATDIAGSLLAVHTRSERGVRRVRHARAAVLATGYYDSPNMLGVPGEDLPHVSHYYTEAHPYYRRHVIVVGGKNSAAETALDLYRHGAHVTLVHRRARLGDSIKYWVRPDIENRIAAGEIAARFNARVTEIRPTEVVVAQDGASFTMPADAVFLMTGYHADERLLAACGLHVDPDTGAPAHNPATLETEVPGVYVAGAVTSGWDGNRIFIENGRLHGEQIVSAIVRNRTA
jgi:thioredoxin reductase (NADPH)